MLIPGNSELGTPIRLYRSPSEIRADMQSISARINEIQDSLSVRNMLMEIISELSEDDPKRFVSELAAIVSEAEDALLELKRLRNMLEELSLELEERRFARG